MQDIMNTLVAELARTSNLYKLMNCTNSAKYLEGCCRTMYADFFDSALRSLQADARAVNFADDIRKMNPRYVGQMRKGASSSLQMLIDKIKEEPSKRACYRIGRGMIGFDVERSWYLNKFNDALSSRIKDMPHASDDPAQFAKKTFAIYGDFVKYIYKPFSAVYKECLRNILGTNARHLEPLIEDTFCAESVYLMNGHAVCDVRWLRRMYREKKYRFDGERIIFQGVDDSMPEISFEVWELLIHILYVQKKVLLLTSVFCLMDIEKVRMLAAQTE